MCEGANEGSECQNRESTAVGEELEDGREELKDARAKAGADASRLDDEIQRVTREYRAAHDVYERESARKARLWEEVEGMWQESSRLSLTCAEKEMKARRVRRTAERLLAQSEAQKGEAMAQREKAEAMEKERSRLEAEAERLLARAAESFGCLAGEDFLYWGAAESNEIAYAFSLIDEPETYNLEVVAGGLYQVTLRKGVRFLEPVLKPRAPSADEDRRMEAYFLGDRSAHTDAADETRAPSEPNPGSDD